MSDAPKVLVVEDETMLSNVYQIVLSKHNYQVEVAGNGEEALTKLPAYQPDVVLLDLLMPKMDGMTFLKTLTAKQKARLKVIVYSNLYDADIETEVRRLGASELVLKSSMTPAQLVELIGSYCN